jgi:hypothetical protein
MRRYGGHKAVYRLSRQGTLSGDKRDYRYAYGYDERVKGWEIASFLPITLLKTVTKTVTKTLRKIAKSQT